MRGKKEEKEKSKKKKKMIPRSFLRKFDYDNTLSFVS